MAGNKVDSNITGLAIAEEQSLKVLPATPVWYGMEPNSYSDLGGDLSMVARAPINPSRQNQKGTITDLDASGGFNTDFTKTNLVRLLQGFLFADAREQPSTAPLNAAATVFTSAASADKSYNAAAGLAIFTAGNLALASGWTNAANNGLKKIVTSVAAKITVVETVIDEAAPPAAAKLVRVGHEFAAADAAIVVTSGIPSMTLVAGDFTTMPAFFPGNWIYIGGDVAGSRFVNNRGFARIATVAAKAVTFDDTAFPPVTEAGTGLSIRVFFGTAIRNELDPTLIKRRSYQVERQLGIGDTPGAPQAEYITGAVANEFTLNIPKADKLNADMTFVGCDNQQVTGAPGDTIKAGIRVAALAESAFNTSSDIVRIKMAILDPNTSNPTALFGYVDEANIAITNDVTPNKAVGTLGAFDTTAGNFGVSGSVTAFFTTVAAVKAVRNNADVGLSVIGASKNAGFVFDVPLLGLGGGRLSVEKDAAIMLPLETAGAQSKFGNTLLFTSFPYLPTVAMP
ncbi:MAG: hypothetical protein JWR85_4179 [Marmoricola sp.]|nr:hypothetical protein [Marmoricola sp.]